jgi:dATP pyrophosphohydrolase
LDWRYSIEYEIYAEFLHRYEAGVMHNTEHWFSLQVPEAIDVVLAPREHTAFLWLPYEEAAARCFSSSNADAILQLPRRLAARMASASPDFQLDSQASPRAGERGQ